MRHRSTTLRYLSDFCGRAMRKAATQDAAPRDHFEAGTAAHAVLQAVTDNQIEPDGYDAVADKVVKHLTTQGRKWDGKAQAPMPVELAFAGRDIALGYIRFEIPAAVLIGIAASTLIFQADLSGGILTQLLTGHVSLAAFFLATDHTSSPANRAAMWLFGLGIGFLTILIRAYGIWPDAVPFAVLLMNVVFPLLDRIRPRVKEVVIQDD